MKLIMILTSLILLFSLSNGFCEDDYILLGANKCGIADGNTQWFHKSPISIMADPAVTDEGCSKKIKFVFDSHVYYAQLQKILGSEEQNCVYSTTGPRLKIEDGSHLVGTNTIFVLCEPLK